MFNTLEAILITSKIASLFELKEKDDHTTEPTPWVAYRVKTNSYKIRSFELWGTGQDTFFRVYHAPNINESLKTLFESLSEVISSKNAFVDYRTDDYINLATKIKEILISDEIIKGCKATSRFARTSKFEGLELPDVDIAQVNVIGQTFNWRQIIAIWEENEEDNKLKEVLSQNGIYIQRSEDGTSRYIGSAYGSNGIIGRWMAHLNSLGDAQHLNLFVLENGYNSILFSVIEFIDGTASEIIQKEALWKKTLGTVNHGPYNKVQLNNN